MSASKRRKSSIIKLPDADNRVFSNYFSNVIISNQGQREFFPMRYRVRPHDSDSEVPAKYNLFNARIDSLETRKSWSSLFMQKHGLFPFVRFFEWVDRSNKKKLISFKADQHEIMWAPCLWDEWESMDKTIKFKSFAIITDEPPKEVLEAGHDRCPIFLKEEEIDNWLNPQGMNKKSIYQLLKQKESDYMKLIAPV